MFCFTPRAEALPVLDSKDAAVAIANVTNGMNITSSATNNVIQWVDFSIAGVKMPESMSIEVLATGANEAARAEGGENEEAG